MKKMLFILNPRSGKALIKNKLLEILDIFSKAGYEVLTHVTQYSGDARNIAASMGEDVDIIVCCGGDGTLNETVSGMMELSSKRLLGYIPAGSTNDFASSLKIPRNMTTAARLVEEGEAYPVDIGRFCDDRYFVYIAGFGAFTEVSYLTSQNRKNLLGHQAYMLESVKSLTSLKNYAMRIECEELTLEGNFIFGMITNTMSVGGFKGLVTQNVALNDGEFEVLLIRTPKTPMDLSNIVNYMFLKEAPNEYVHKFRTSALRIFPKESVDWVLDGEFGGTRENVEIINLPRRIHILKKTSEK